VEAFLKQLIFWLITLPLLAQSNVGELRLKVAGQDGLALKASVELSSDATQFHRFFDTDDSGLLSARLTIWPLPLRVKRGFSFFSGLVEVRSALPTEYLVHLSVAAMSTSVNVTAEGTLLDPERATSVNRNRLGDHSHHVFSPGEVAAGPCQLTAGLGV